MPTSPVYKLKIECTNVPCVIDYHLIVDTRVCLEKRGVYNIAQRIYNF